MGYRHHFYKISNAEIADIRKCKTVTELCSWGKHKHYPIRGDNDDGYYLAPYDIGKEIYDFGKDADWATEIQTKNESIFESKELKDFYEDYDPVICSKDDFLYAINIYAQKISEYYENLLAETKDSNLTVEQRCKIHVEKQLREWKNDFRFFPVNTDLSSECINNSWLYEYAIFELTRIYKTFDWENDTLILLGW